MADRYLLESSAVDGYLLEDATGVYLLEVEAITETIIAKEFPMSYYNSGVSAKELKSRVSGATITEIAKDFPPELVKAGVANTLKSRWA